MPKLHKKALALILAITLVAGFGVMAFAQSSFDEQHWFRTGDYDICYRVVPAQGKQVGRIFMIHGLLMSSLYYRELMQYFSEAGYLCVAMDLPGFGESTREGRGVEPIDREAIAAALMEELAPGEAWIVVGHSMGGGIAVNLALWYPDQVSALLLYAPGNIAGLGEGWLPDFAAETLDRKSVV